MLKHDTLDLVREVLGSQNFGVLATSGNGAPYTSLVGFVVSPDMRRIVFTTLRDTRKYSNIVNRSAVSMLITSSSNLESDIINAAAVTALGDAGEVSPREKDTFQRLYLAKFRGLTDFVENPDCVFVRIQVEKYIVVTRFQKVDEVVLAWGKKRVPLVTVSKGNIRIGYPCINRSIGCTANHTFRLASYSEKRMDEAITANIRCLLKILEFNIRNNIKFFRISSDIVPFASHEICSFKWKEKYAKEFRGTGKYIKNNRMRVSMHPDQFVLINALKEDIVERSVAELEYHAAVLDLMGLDRKAKIQIHVGGAYGDKEAAMARFTERYSKLSSQVKRRLVVENDDRLFTVADCLKINGATGIPVLFDVFHHQCLSGGMEMEEALISAAGTWRKVDGPIMIDYSEQEKGKRPGSHAEKASVAKFKKFIALIRKLGLDADVMLEIKDKEKSAMRVLSSI